MRRGPGFEHRTQQPSEDYVMVIEYELVDE
jgi:hypothetical protein